MHKQKNTCINKFRKWKEKCVIFKKKIGFSRESSLQTFAWAGQVNEWNGVRWSYGSNRRRRCDSRLEFLIFIKKSHILLFR